MAQTGDDDDDLPEPPQLRRLRLMVSALILVLIGGVVTIAVTLVIRLSDFGPIAPQPVTAQGFALPEGAEITAIGRALDAVMIVTRDGAGAETMRLFDPETGAERSTHAIRRE